MKDTSDSSTLALAAVDFQSDVDVWGTIPESLKALLRTEAFPISAPLSLRSTPDYNGIKIFSYQKLYLCISYFYDGGKNDRHNRAVPSAKVLVIGRDFWWGSFRNLPAVSDFLVDATLDDTAVDKLQFVLQSLFEEAAFSESEETYRAFISQQRVNYERIAEAIGLLIDHRSLVICCPNRMSGQTFFATLFAIVPVEVLESTSWSTYANTLSSHHENILLHVCEVPAPESSSGWLEKIKTRFEDSTSMEAVKFDIATGHTTRPGKKSKRYRVSVKVVQEIYHNSLELPLSFENRYQLYEAILGGLFIDEAFGIENFIAQKIPGKDLAEGLMSRIGMFK